MGCCSPEYRKVIKAKEEELNQRGKDSVPLSLKMLITLVIVGTISAYYLW
jgi:hypothetical protein